MQSKPQLSLWPYGLAILLVGLATILTFLFFPFLERTVFILFFAAVMACSWYGGLGSGFLAILLSVLAGLYLFLPPSFSFAGKSLDGIVQVNLFVLVSLFINWLTGARQRAITALRESETRFRIMADTAPVMIWMAGLDKQRTYFNKTWLEFVGRTQTGELSAGWVKSVHPDDYERNLNIYTTAFHACQPFTLEYRLLRADGEYRWVMDKGVPRFEDEQFLGYIGSCIDIHERKQAEVAERLLAEMRERNRLAQDLHDTVAQALGYLNLKIGLTYSVLDSDGIDMAKANLQELKQVISETYTDVREEIFNLRAKVRLGLSFMEMLNRYIDKYRRFYNLDIQLIQEADLALFDFPPDVAPQLIRTIQEALINIRKHAQVKTATIRLGQEEGHPRITIEDQGQGFDLNSVKGKTSSFGLQIMRERVESVGGTLEVDTAPGRGSRIILRYHLENRAS